MTFDEQAATLDRQGVVDLLQSREQLAARIEELKRQLEWFKSQLFGSKSERRFVDSDSRQLALGEWKQAEAPGAEITIAEHHRRSRTDRSEEETVDDPVRFDESVPVE